MSTALSDTATQDADRYLKDLTPYLEALPADERADLLEDLAQHLREVAAEPGPPLAERLGSAESYATELLASAGVEVDKTPRPRALVRATNTARRIRGSWLGREASRLWPAVRPAWWLARGYLAVSLLAALGNGYPGFPLPRLGGNPALGLAAVIVAAAISVRLGQRSLPKATRVVVVGANVALAIYALVLVGKVNSHQVNNYVQVGAGPQVINGSCLTNGSGQNITNLYAYGADGRLIDPVLLYDQNGHPIDNLCPEFDDSGRRLVTQYGQDVNGAPVYNAFPRRQSVAVAGDPAIVGLGSPALTVPVKPPAVVVPSLATTPTTVPTSSTTVPTSTVPSTTAPSGH